ncbi:hypothetical protein BJ741DRAFT_654796 [Chytriomyces cf. hyalinus JEL632]|nr:hypothetical protein BJ741DRAFT_654796 [Chytriomyces cf. hyalinus JEL632]
MAAFEALKARWTMKRETGNGAIQAVTACWVGVVQYIIFTAELQQVNATMSSNTHANPISALFIVAGSPHYSPTYHLPHPHHAYPNPHGDSHHSYPHADSHPAVVPVRPPSNRRIAARTPTSSDDGVFVPELGKHIGDLGLIELEWVAMHRHQRDKHLYSALREQVHMGWGGGACFRGGAFYRQGELETTSADPISTLFVVGHSDNSRGTGARAGTGTGAGAERPRTSTVYYLPHPCPYASKRTVSVCTTATLSGDDNVPVYEAGKRIGELSIEELERIMVLRHERRKKRMQIVYDEAIESWKKNSAKWPRLT